jgi:hypothetical protein
MANIKIHFMHPVDGRTLTVTLDESMSAQEAISELINADFIAPNAQGYNLGVKGGPLFTVNQSFSDLNVKENDTIRVIPATDAG